MPAQVAAVCNVAARNTVWLVRQEVAAAIRRNGEPSSQNVAVACRVRCW